MIDAGHQSESVTQEELDNVINFLSGTRQKPNHHHHHHHLYNRNTMTSLNSADSVSLTSSLGQSMTSSSSSGSDNRDQLFHHRLSDGAITDIVRGEAQRNTWPYRSNHGDDNDAIVMTTDPTSPQQYQAQERGYGSQTSLNSDPEFLNYVQSVGALIGQTSPIWSPQHQKATIRSWPTQKQHSE